MDAQWSVECEGFVAMMQEKSRSTMMAEGSALTFAFAIGALGCATASMHKFTRGLAQTWRLVHNGDSENQSIVQNGTRLLKWVAAFR